MIFKLIEFSFNILKYIKKFLSEKRKYVFDYFQILLLTYLCSILPIKYRAATSLS